MNHRLRRLFVITCLTGALAVAALPAKAQNALTYAFTGIVLSVDDSNNFFQDTYTPGMSISGTYTFSDSGYGDSILFGDPTVHFYDGFNDRDLALHAGPRSLQSGASNLVVTVADNTTDPFLGTGDTYRVQNLLSFPSFFTDPSGDPSFDPDGFFLTSVFSMLNLHDPTGAALSSFGLPLTPPDLSAFSERTGSVSLVDGNGELPNAAQMTFQINTLQAAAVQAVPEPGTLVFLALGVTLFLARRMTSRRESAAGMTTTD